MRIRQFLFFSGLLVSLFGVPLARGQEKAKVLRVTVVDIAGGQIYVEPGQEQGVKLGQVITIGKRRYTVLSLNAQSATLALHASWPIPKVGTKGTAQVNRQNQEQKHLVVPTKLVAFTNVWTKAELPAKKQHPENVIIAMTRRRYPTEVTVIGRGGIRQLLSSEEDTVAHFSARTIVSSQPLANPEFTIDADLEVGYWFGRSTAQGSASRPLVQLQELRFRYGSPNASNLALGRLRSASRLVGMLDGARVRGDLSNEVSVFAFGGVVPSYLDGSPSANLARFGGGIQYIDEESALRPDAEIALYASNYGGAIDEKRASLNAHIHPGPLSFSLSSELSLFASDNPWGADAVELTLVSIDSRYRKGRFSTGLSLAAYQPERSRWLESLLPASWLCTASATTEACNGEKNNRYWALYSGSYIGESYQVQAGVTAVVDDGMSQLAAYGDVRIPLSKASLGVRFLVSDTDFLQSFATRFAFSRPIGQRADLSLYYRPEIHTYEASLESVVEQRVGAEGALWLRSNLFLRLTGETVHSSEIRYLSTFLTLVWRTGL